MSVLVTYKVTHTYVIPTTGTTTQTYSYWSYLPTATATFRYQEDSNAWQKSTEKIAGGIVGGLVFLGLLLCLVYYVNRKSRPRNTASLPLHADQNRNPLRPRDIDVVMRAADPSTIPGVIAVNYAEGSNPYDYGGNAVASSSRAGPSSVSGPSNAVAGPSNYAGASSVAGPSNRADEDIPTIY